MCNPPQVLRVTRNDRVKLKIGENNNVTEDITEE